MTDKQTAAFTFSLNRKKLRTVRRREGRYLLRTNLTDNDPALLGQYYIQLVAVEEAFRNSLTENVLHMPCRGKQLKQQAAPAATRCSVRRRPFCAGLWARARMPCVTARTGSGRPPSQRCYGVAPGAGRARLRHPMAIPRRECLSLPEGVRSPPVGTLS